MTTTSATDGDRQKVWELIKDIRIALLVTTADGGEMRGRPMAAMNKTFDGTLWFASRDGAPKLGEIADNSHVLLAYSEPKSQNYVSVAGSARVLHDTAKVKELWSEPMRVWFPKGPEDPEIALIRVGCAKRRILGRAVLGLGLRRGLCEGATHRRGAARCRREQSG